MTGVQERAVRIAGITAGLVMLLACEQPVPTSKGKDAGVPVHGPGYRFRGPDAAQQAAVDAILFIYPSTARDRLERGGMICWDREGAAFATEAVVGVKEGSVDPTKSPCPPGTKSHGDYHTHPVGPLKNRYAPFSESDTKLCRAYEACWVGQAFALGQQPNVWIWLPGLNSQLHVYP
jgi:hypothetical protein